MVIKEIDVTIIAPRERHPMIFKTFDDLKKGDSFIINIDHDPKPLFYSFLHERAEQFDWEYLDQGPVTWKVKILKK